MWPDFENIIQGTKLTCVDYFQNFVKDSITKIKKKNIFPDFFQKQFYNKTILQNFKGY